MSIILSPVFHFEEFLGDRLPLQSSGKNGTQLGQIYGASPYVRTLEPTQSWAGPTTKAEFSLRKVG
jgi:hypothetical protein